MKTTTVPTQQAQINNQSMTNLSDESSNAPKQQTVDGESLSFVEKKMIEAFGATLTNAGEFDWNDGWVLIWERLVKLRCQLYVLPGGAIGRRVVSFFAIEVTHCS